MKTFCFISMMMLLAGCGGTINSNLLDKIPGRQQEKLAIDVFSLTFHKQMGSCAALPITHRVLTFAPVLLSPNGDDYFIGALDILLDEASKTYKARYREFPSQGNIDQTVFETTLTGNFEVVKTTSNTGNDELILENVGVVTATINSNKVGFILKLDGDINRVVTEDETIGRVIYSSTPFIADNCLL